MGVITVAAMLVVCSFFFWRLRHRFYGLGICPALPKLRTLIILFFIIVSWGTRQLWGFEHATPSLVIAVVFLFYSLKKPITAPTSPTQPVKQSTFSDPIACRNILATTGLDSTEVLTRDSVDDSINRNILSGVQSRSEPNQRLREAFGVDNSFTTKDDSYCQRFRSSAERKLRLSPERWEEIADLAQTVVDSQTSQVSIVNLVELVQLLSLKISLLVLFEINPLDVDDHGVGIIAKEINRLWLESKASELANGPIFTDEGKLPRALNAVIPDLPQGPLLTYIIPAQTSFRRVMRYLLPKACFELVPRLEVTSRTNPLNYILPAYETLWRVVLRCFIEVSFRNGVKHAEWQQVLHEFLQSPRLATLKDTESSPSGLSAECIVNEALRLYPPTRRIYRKFQLPDKDPEIIAADIEQCHRKQDIWGENALEFKPSRWKEIKRETKEDRESMPYAAFMPFGAKRFLCPATTDFGPRMIALLVGALATKISSAEWDLAGGDPSDEPTIYCNGPLDSGRRAFWSYQLVRKEPSNN